jgi:F-type H+-transporting ATPase subunit delta
VSVTAQNAARLLLDRGRLNALPAIAKALWLLADDSAGRVRAKVTSAQPIDAATESRLRAALTKATGKSVVIEKHQDAALLAGIVTQVGDVVYDGSLAAQLAELRQHWSN